MAKGTDLVYVFQNLRQSSGALRDGLAELLRLHLETAAEIEGNDSPGQPPKRIWHQNQPLHAFGKPKRVKHGRGEQRENGDHNQRAGQAVQPVHETIKPPLALHLKLGPELAQCRLCIVSAALRARFGVLHEHPGRFSDHVSATTENQFQPVHVQPPTRLEKS